MLTLLRPRTGGGPFRARRARRCHAGPRAQRLGYHRLRLALPWSALADRDGHPRFDDLDRRLAPLAGQPVELNPGADARRAGRAAPGVVTSHRIGELSDWGRKALPCPSVDGFAEFVTRWRPTFAGGPCATRWSTKPFRAWGGLEYADYLRRFREAWTAGRSRRAAGGSGQWVRPRPQARAAVRRRGQTRGLKLLDGSKSPGRAASAIAPEAVLTPQGDGPAEVLGAALDAAQAPAVSGVTRRTRPVAAGRAGQGPVRRAGPAGRRDQARSSSPLAGCAEYLLALRCRPGRLADGLERRLRSARGGGRHLAGQGRTPHWLLTRRLDGRSGPCCWNAPTGVAGGGLDASDPRESAADERPDGATADWWSRRGRPAGLVDVRRANSIRTCSTPLRLPLSFEPLFVEAVSADISTRC